MLSTFLFLFLPCLLFAPQCVDFAVPEDPDLLVCQSALYAVRVVSQVFVILIKFFSFFFNVKLVRLFGWIDVCCREMLGLEGLEILLDDVR